MDTPNQNPNPNPADNNHNQELHRLFSAIQVSAASRASSDAVDPFPSSIARHRPLQTDFFRELSLFNTHFSSESDERSQWAQFLPEHLRPGNLEKYLEKTDKPNLFGDSLWWVVDQESSGQDCDSRLATVNETKMPVVKDVQKNLQVKSVSEAILKSKQDNEVKSLGVNQIIEHGATLAGSSGARRESGSTSKKNKEEKKIFKPCSQTSDHIQYSRDQLLQLRKVKFVYEAILKIKQEVEVEFHGVTHTIEHGATLVSKRGASKESGSTSKEKKEEKKAANITADAKEEPEVGDKAKPEEVSKKKTRGMSDASKAKRKMKKRKKRAEMNRKLGVNRLKIQPILKPKLVSHCRHYLHGRCYEGETCKFSHDVVPLTKSKPCFHFARQSCMKGDDCPFDHQLSKYPCKNYVSSGFCNRGENCFFSHEITPKQDSVSAMDIIKKPETKSLNPANSSDSIQVIKSPLILETGKATAGNGTANKAAQERNGLSSGNFPFGTFTTRMQANLSQKSPLLSKFGAPTSSGTSKGSPASANETLKPPKGFTFLNFGNSKPNDSSREASQKTSNDVLPSQGMISNVSDSGKMSEATSASKVTDILFFGKSSSDNHGEKIQLSKISEAPSASNVTDILIFGKSSSDNHGEKKQLSFPTFGNSCLVASAGDKQNSVATSQKPNVVPFKFPTSTKSSTPSTSNDVLPGQGMISNVSDPGKISEAPSASNVTDIFIFGKSSSDNHGEKKQLSFPTFGNSCLVASAGDKQNSVATNQKPNVVPFQFPTSTKSSTPFLTRLDNVQVKDTNSSGKRSFLSTLGFATKVDSEATRNPLLSTPAITTGIRTLQTEYTMNVNPSVCTSSSSGTTKNAGSSSGCSTSPKKPANQLEIWENLWVQNSQSKP